MNCKQYDHKLSSSMQGQHCYQLQFAFCGCTGSMCSPFYVDYYIKGCIMSAFLFASDTKRQETQLIFQAAPCPITLICFEWHVFQRQIISGNPEKVLPWDGDQVELCFEPRLSSRAFYKKAWARQQLDKKARLGLEVVLISKTPPKSGAKSKEIYY